MVGQFLTGYIKRCGLEAEDVPKVAATFLGAKYCVWAASVALAMRYRPLRRVFLSRREALLQSASRPFSERKRLWLVEALDRHVKSGRAAGSVGSGSSRALTTRASLKKLPNRVRKALPFTYMILIYFDWFCMILYVECIHGCFLLFDVVSFYCEFFIDHSESLLQQTLLQAVTAGIASARAQYRAANYSWKLAGWQLLRTQERQKLGVVAGVARCLSQSPKHFF